MAGVYSSSKKTYIYSSSLDLYMEFTWYVQEQSTDNNTSTIFWEANLVNNAGYDGRIISSADKQYILSVPDVNTWRSYNTIGIGYSNSGSVSVRLGSGSFVVPHNEDGTATLSYTFIQQIEITFAGTWIPQAVCSQSNIELPKISRAAKPLSVSTFTDENNPVMTYSNPAGNNVDQLDACISLTGSNPDVPYRTISKTGSSYTFELTEEERETLRNAFPDAASAVVKFYIRSIIGGEYFFNSIDVPFTIVPGYPRVIPQVNETAESQTAHLTGDSGKLIKYYSDVYVDTHAVANKGSSIKVNKITNGSQVITTGWGTMTDIESGTFRFEVVDSRGFKTALTTEKEVIEYKKLTCNVEMGYTSTAGDLSFTVSGNYFNGNFGVADNTLTMRYRYKTSSTEYGEWVAITPTINTDNTYTADANVTGLDYREVYTFQISVADELMTLEPEANAKSRPVFDWSGEDFKFNVPVTFVEGFTDESDPEPEEPTEPTLAIEVGTWTPSFGTASAISAYQYQRGWYQKIGNMVTISFGVSGTSTGATSTDLDIVGIPYTPVQAAYGGGVCSKVNAAAGYNFQCWTATIFGNITARMQACNQTSTGILTTSATGCRYPAEGTVVVVGGTISYYTEE